MNNLLSRVQGCLAGVCIGDGMFVPWETYTPERILEATSGLGVIGFQEAPERRFHEMRALPLGAASDDWGLTNVVGLSIVRCGVFDLFDCAKAHVDAVAAGSIPGMGSTTRRGIESLALGRSPYVPPPPVPKGKSGGGGNGIAMKVSPVALYGALRQGEFQVQPLLSYTMRLGNLTHPDHRASIAAYAVGAVISSVLHKQMLPDDSYDFLHWLIGEVERAERMYGPELRQYEIQISPQLKRIFGERLLDDPAALRQKIGTSCFALESIPFAIGTLLRHPTDFRSGVLEAGNAGGDTDSNASMVGAMIGANMGLETIPQEWRNFRPEYAEALWLGAELYRVSTTGSDPDMLPRARLPWGLSPHQSASTWRHRTRRCRR